VGTVTPYYEDERATIYHGSCDDVLPHLSGVDLVFTSPPYNLGIGGSIHAGSLAARKLANGYGSHDDAMVPEEYEEWQRNVVRLCWETLSDTGAIFYNHKPRVQNGVSILPTTYGEGLPLRQVVIWDRGTGLNFSPSFFLPKTEWIVVWAKDGWRLTSRSASQLGDIWRIPPETRQDHPAPFPAALPRMAIAATDAAVVLDPFMGSGSTLRAALDLGRRAIGIELEERFCELAATRLGQMVLPLGDAS
jgi:DNA modification methylase